MLSPWLIDIAIVLILGLYTLAGFRRGFLLLLLELIGTILALYLAIKLAPIVTPTLTQFFALPSALGRPLVTIGLWLILETIIAQLTALAYRFIPSLVRESLLNRMVGVFPSVAKGLVMVAIGLTLLLLLPIQSPAKSAILASRIGQPLVETTQEIEQSILKRYHNEITDVFTFLTNTPIGSKRIEPTESYKLHFTYSKGQPDPGSEATMLRLVNEERVKVGLKPLVADPEIRVVARAHAQDMLVRGYFSHDNPDGEDPFERLAEAGITYLTAGENLAFAPTVELAHIGLMNSPKHKENILYPEFGRLGIGVIDAGIYGKMFVQEFRN